MCTNPNKAACESKQGGTTSSQPVPVDRGGLFCTPGKVLAFLRAPAKRYGMQLVRLYRRHPPGAALRSAPVLPRGGKQQQKPLPAAARTGQRTKRAHLSLGASAFACVLPSAMFREGGDFHKETFSCKETEKNELPQCELKAAKFIEPRRPCQRCFRWKPPPDPRTNKPSRL